MENEQSGSSGGGNTWMDFRSVGLAEKLDVESERERGNSIASFC